MTDGLNFNLNIDKRMKGGAYMHLFSSILAGLGSLFANAGSAACLWVWWDEPECPKSLIK